MKQIRPLLGVIGLLIAGTLAAPARADSVLALKELDILSSHPITNASRYSAPPPGQQGAPSKNPFPAVEYVGDSHLIIQFLGTALEGSHITTLYQTEAAPLGVMDVAWTEMLELCCGYAAGRAGSLSA